MQLHKELGSITDKVTCTRAAPMNIYLQQHNIVRKLIKFKNIEEMTNLGQVSYTCAKIHIMLDYSGNLDKVNKLALLDDLGIKFSSI